MSLPSDHNCASEVHNRQDGQSVHEVAPGHEMTPPSIYLGSTLPTERNGRWISVIVIAVQLRQYTHRVWELSQYLGYAAESTVATLNVLFRTLVLQSTSAWLVLLPPVDRNATIDRIQKSGVLAGETSPHRALTECRQKFLALTEFKRCGDGGGCRAWGGAYRRGGRFRCGRWVRLRRAAKFASTWDVMARRRSPGAPGDRRRERHRLDAQRFGDHP